MKLVAAVEKDLRKEQLSRFREFLVEKGGRINGVSSRQQEMLLDVCPDADLCATAVVMENRPQWVTAIIGRQAGK